MSSDEPGLAAPTRDSSLMRSVNVSMRQLADTLPDERELIPFFCECQTPSCYSAAWMAANTFDAAVAAETGWLLLDGHKPSVPWRQEDPPSSRGTERFPDAAEPRDLHPSPPVARHWRSLRRRRLDPRVHLDQASRS